MGNSSSRLSNKGISPGMSADAIEKYYDAIAKARASRADAGENVQSSEPAAEDDANQDGDDTDTLDTDTRRTGFSGAASDITDNAGLAPEQAVAAKLHLDTALQALDEQKQVNFNNAMGALVKFGINTHRLAKVACEWVKEHLYETAAIVVPLILLACTPAILGAVGFGAGGIAAGSIAAGMQAGIGNVVAGSLFAVLTSAGMGGGAIVVVLGLAWGVPTAVLGSIAVLKQWRREGQVTNGEDVSKFKQD